jgi:hypothetical protein
MPKKAVPYPSEKVSDGRAGDWQDSLDRAECLRIIRILGDYEIHQNAANQSLKEAVHAVHKG